MISHSEPYREADSPLISFALYRSFNFLMGVTVSVFILGVLTFGEPYSFLHHAFSYFGRIRTPNGSPNTLSFIIYSIGMVASALICFHINRLHHGSHYHNLIKICGIGYLIMLVPCDLYNPAHMAGAALVFGTLWLYTLITLIELIPFTGIRRFILYQVLLQGTILPYAFLYALNSPMKQAVQKFALFGLISALKIAITEYRKMEEEAIAGNSSTPY